MERLAGMFDIINIEDSAQKMQLFDLHVSESDTPLALLSQRYK